MMMTYDDDNASYGVCLANLIPHKRLVILYVSSGHYEYSRKCLCVVLLLPCSFTDVFVI
jgi:hypothetical protein